MSSVNTVLIVALAFSIATEAVPAQGTSGTAGIESITAALSFRNVGPFRTSAWITEIAVPETPLRDHLYTIYAASRSGGQDVAQRH